jgi:iron complex outermembrane recepter protein
VQGKNTAGGVIKLLRSKPTGQLGGKMALVMGDNDLLDVKGLVNFSVIESMLAVKLNYNRKSGGGYITNTATGNTEGDTDFYSAGISALWNPNRDIELQYSVTLDRDNSDSEPFINSSPDLSVLCQNFGACDSDSHAPRVYSSQNAHPASFDVDLHILRLVWDLDHHELTFVTGFRDLEEQIVVDFDASEVDLFLSSRPASETTQSQEVRVASNWSDIVKYVTGLYYWNREYTMHQTTLQLFDKPYYRDGGRRFTRQAQDTQSWALFAQTDINLTESWVLTLGVRSTREEKSSRTQYEFIDADGLWVDGDSDTRVVIGTPVALFKGSDAWDDVTPKIGLSYDVSDNVFIYGSYTEGFRSGGFNGRARSPEALGPYEPEAIKSSELGVKSDWLNGRLRFNPTYFYTKYQNKQEEFATFVGDTPLTIIQNAAEANIWGVELELEYVLGGFKVSADYGYLDSSYEDFTVLENQGGVPTVVDKSDHLLLLAPRNTFALTTMFSHRFADNALTYTLGARYRDSYQTSGDNPRHGLVDPYTIVDASVSYEIERHRIALFAKNLTNESYRPFTKNVTDSNGYSLWSFSKVNPPRVWGVELAMTF